MPKNRSGRPIHWRIQPSTTCSSSVDAGDDFQSMPLVFTAAVNASARMPGADPEVEK